MNRRLSTQLLRRGSFVATLCFVFVTFFGFSFNSLAAGDHDFIAGTHIDKVFSELQPGTTYTSPNSENYPKCTVKIPFVGPEDEFNTPLCAGRFPNKPYCASIGEDLGGGRRGACVSEADYVKLCKISGTNTSSSVAHAPTDKDLQRKSAPSACNSSDPEPTPTDNSGGGGGGDTGSAGGGSVDLSSSGLTPPDSSLIKGVIKVDTANELIGGMLNFFLSFVSVIAVGVLIYGGFMYITSGVIEENADRGKKAIVGSVTGIILILASWTIVNTVVNLDAGSFAGGEDRPDSTVSFNYNIEGNPFFISLSKNSSKPIQQLDNATVAFDGNAVIFNCTKPHNFHDWERYVLGADGYGVRLETLGTPYTIKCLGGGRSQDINVSYSNQ